MFEKKSVDDLEIAHKTYWIFWFGAQFPLNVKIMV